MSNLPHRKPASGNKPIPSRVKIDAAGRWTLVPPHCVFELEPDLADVEMLMKEGDFEAARDAALYILEECQDMTAAHLLLGEIAEKHMNDLIVAKAHYGYVFEITLKWLGAAYEKQTMNGGQKINRISLQCAEGLKRVLEKRGEKIKAGQVDQYIEAWKFPSRPPVKDQNQSSERMAPKAQRPSGRPASAPPKRRPMMPRPDRKSRDDDSK